MASDWSGHVRGRVGERNHCGGRNGGGAQPPVSRGAASGHQHRRPLHVRRVEQEEQHACAVWGSLRSTWIVLKIQKIQYTYISFFKKSKLVFLLDKFIMQHRNMMQHKNMLTLVLSLNALNLVPSFLHT